jgi:hypothetical protein
MAGHGAALNVDGAAVGVEHAFAHHLGKRRMREDGLHQLGFGGLQRFRDAPSLRKFIDVDKFGHAELGAGCRSYRQSS